MLALTLSNGEHLTTTPGHAFATSERGGFTLAGKPGIMADTMAGH